jgi:N-acetylglucosaminyl-diphospho-decaprenol L-rhamnosyltransferase
MPTVSIVVVTYNSADTIAACISSVPDEDEVVVVDQGSSDDTIAVARRVRPNALIVRAGTNRGFGAGCNLGAANASGSTVVFLNPDAALCDHAVRRLDAALARPGVGLVGPAILDASGSTITRCRRWGTPWRDTVTLLVPDRLLPGSWRQDVPGDTDVYITGGEVSYVQGACMAIRRDLFDEVGQFDEEFFLYSEEESLAYRLLMDDFTTRLEPNAAVIHVGHSSTDKTGHFAVRQRFRSRAIWYQKRYGRRRGLCGGLLLAFGLAVLLVTAPARRVVRLRKVEDGAWCRAALAGVATGMLRHPVMAPTTAVAPVKRSDSTYVAGTRME